MAISKWTVLTLLGVMSLSSGAQAGICDRKPDLEICKHLPPPPVQPEETDAGVDVSAEGPAEVVVQDTVPATPAHPAPQGSSARCWAYAYAGGTTGGQTTATAAAEAAAYVCGGEGSATAYAAAEATATLFAQAVAQATVYCEASGDTAFYASADALAVQTAEEWLTAYADAVAYASVCGLCDVHAQSWVYVEKYVFLEAVAEASAILKGYTNAKTLPEFVGYVNSYQSTLKTAVATAYAEALAGAELYYDKFECFAWANANGCIYISDDTEKCD